jgi:hypothetical protein
MNSTPEDRPPRVAVSKGLTLPLGNYSSSRVDYRIEADVPDGLSAKEALVDLEGTVDIFLSKFKEEHGSFKQATEAPTASPGKAAVAVPDNNPVPNLDPSFLDTLPWKPFSSGKGEWVFANVEGGQLLREELTHADKKTVTIGPKRYRLSGDKDQFIQRFPTEAEK